MLSWAGRFAVRKTEYNGTRVYDRRVGSPVRRDETHADGSQYCIRYCYIRIIYDIGFFSTAIVCQDFKRTRIANFVSYSLRPSPNVLVRPVCRSRVNRSEILRKHDCNEYSPVRQNYISTESFRARMIRRGRNDRTRPAGLF